MKNKIVKNKGLRKIFFALAGGMVFLSMFLIGCQSEASLEQEQKSEVGVEYPIPQDAVVVIERTALYPKEHELSERLRDYGDAVHFGVTAAFYYLPKDIKNYALYRQILEETTKITDKEYRKGNTDLSSPKGTLKLTIGAYNAQAGANPIVKVEKPTTEELEARFIFSDEEKPQLQARESLRSKMTLTQAQEFSTRFQNLSCDRSSRNPCIPFRFAADGCYARDHYMRKLMAESDFLNFALHS